MSFKLIKNKGRVKVWKGSKDVKSAYKKQIGDELFYYDSYADFMRNKFTRKVKVKKK